MSAYPTGYDAFTNPAGSDPLNTSGAKLHSTQHGQVNDAIEAIEAELGLSPSGSEATVAARLTAIEASIGGGGGGGLVLVDSGTPSAAASFDITGFDSTYDDYRLLMRLTASTNAILKAQLAVSGTPSTSGYNSTRAYWGTSSASDNDQQGTDEWMWFQADTGGPAAFGFDIVSPAVAAPTSFYGNASIVTGGFYISILGGVHSASTAYDKITVTAASGTLTGRWALYGYAK